MEHVLALGQGGLRTDFESLMESIMENQICLTESQINELTNLAFGRVERASAA